MISTTTPGLRTACHPVAHRQDGFRGAVLAGAHVAGRISAAQTSQTRVWTLVTSSARTSTARRGPDMRRSSGLETSAASGYVCPVDDAAESFVVGVVVAPDDVPADHAGLLLVAGMVGAVEREVAQRRELRLYAVQPGRIRRRVSDLDVVRRSPGADPGVFARGQVRAEVVADDRDAGAGRVQRAQVAAELQEPGPGLARLDVPVQLVLAQLVGGEQVPDPGGAV